MPRVTRTRNRDPRGLTPRMVKALPVVANARSQREGVLAAVDMKIVSERVYYEDWQKDPRWIEALDREWLKYHGAVARRVQSLYLRHAEQAAAKLLRIAAGQEVDAHGQLIDAAQLRVQMDACIEVLDRSGAMRGYESSGVDVFKLLAQAIMEQQRPAGATPVLAFGMKLGDQQADEVDVDDVRVE